MATKTETLSNPASCLNKAAADEPVFVLRGHDVLAANTVRLWAWARRNARGMDDPVAIEADEVAKAMDNWKMGEVMDAVAEHHTTKLLDDEAPRG